MYEQSINDLKRCYIRSSILSAGKRLDGCDGDIGYICLFSREAMAVAGCKC